MSTQVAPQRGKRTQEFLSGTLAQVDIAKIEKELQALWQSAANSDSDANDSVTRACALNFILYSEDQSSEREASDLLDDITLRHPCRAILAINKPGDKGLLEAWVSARCHITDAKTRKQICCEQITVRGDGINSPELASVVLPLIVSDLPVIMWWRPTQISKERMTPFLDSVDKFVFDSGSEPQNLAFFSALSDLLNRKSNAERPARFVDLNWRRSLPWRESIALAFDRRHTEMSPDYLDGITGIDLQYGLPEASASASSGLTNQALLIVGWIASTLKWKLSSVTSVDGQTLRSEFASATKKVSVTITGVPSHVAGTGDIGSITIKCDSPKKVTVVAKQERFKPGIAVTCSDCAQAQAESGTTSMFELNEAPEGLLIDKELESPSVEATFKPAVKCVVEILEMLTKSSANK